MLEQTVAPPEALRAAEREVLVAGAGGNYTKKQLAQRQARRKAVGLRPNEATPRGLHVGRLTPKRIATHKAAIKKRRAAERAAGPAKKTTAKKGAKKTVRKTAAAKKASAAAKRTTRALPGTRKATAKKAPAKKTAKKATKRPR